MEEERRERRGWCGESGGNGESGEEDGQKRRKTLDREMEDGESSCVGRGGRVLCSM